MKRKLTLFIVLSFSLLLFACADETEKQDIESQDIESNEITKDNQNEENEENEENNDEIKFDYETIRDNNLNYIDFKDLDSHTDYIHFDHESHEAFDYMRMSGSVVNAIHYNNNYYFVNASQFNVHNKDTLERVKVFQDDGFKPTISHHSNRYTFFYDGKVEKPVSAIDRDTHQRIDFDIMGDKTVTLNSSIVLDDNLLLTGIYEDANENIKFNLYAIDLSTGTQNFILENSHESFFSKHDIKIDDNHFYAFDVSGNLYAFNRNTFEKSWQILDKNFAVEEVAEDDNFLYALSTDAMEVLKIDKSNGEYETVFSNENYTLTGVKAIQGNTLLVSGVNNKHLGIINLDDGTVLKEIEITTTLIDEVPFKDAYYLLLIEDGYRGLMRVPFDLNEETIIINLNSEGSQAHFTMNVIDNTLQVNINRHLYTFE